MVDFFQAGYSEGRARAYLADQQNTRDNNKDVRDEKYLGIAGEELEIKKDYRNIAQQELGIKFEELGMKKEEFGWKREEFGWKREDRVKAQELEAGLADASKSGGYSGAIDYLAARDPERAIKLHADKLRIDESIMNNDVLQSTLGNKKQEAMFASYAMLGKMSQGLANLPPEQQPMAYKQMLPMIRSVWKDAPDELNDEAKIAGSLFIAQATPENMLFKVEKDSFQARAQSTKVYQDYQDALKTGDQELIDFTKKQVDASESKANYSAGMETRYKLQQANNRADKTRQYQQDLNKNSEMYIAQVEAFSKLDSLMDQLEEDPGNSNTAAMISTTLARIAEPIGVHTDKDVDRLAGSAGIANWSKNSTAFFLGKNVPLNKTELAQIKSLSEYIKNSAYAKQKAYEQEFDNTVGTEFSDVINDKAIIKPTKVYERAQHNRTQMKKARQLLKSNGLDKLPVNMKQQAIEAINAYDDPAKKQAVVEKIKKSMGQQQQVQQPNPSQGQQ